jgi:hypothetical protein
MKKRAKRRRASIPTKTAHSVLAERVKQIEAGGLASARFTDAPSAVPRAAEAQRISKARRGKLVATFVTTVFGVMGRARPHACPIVWRTRPQLGLRCSARYSRMFLRLRHRDWQKCAP